MTFPNLRNKHTESPLFSPKDFILYARKNNGKFQFPMIKPPEGVIICYSRDLMNFIRENHRTNEYHFSAGKLLLLPETRNKIAVMGEFGIGAPVAGSVLEELIAFGVRKFISIGTAGAIQKKIKIGELVVCERAIRDEGTSHHYLKPSKYAYPSEKMTQKIKSSLSRLNQKYLAGTSWTIDAPYMETVKEIKQYQKEGVATVEMEASALFAVAQHRKVQIGALLTVSDSLAELEWKPQFKSKKTIKGLETIYKTALDVLLS